MRFSIFDHRLTKIKRKYIGVYSKRKKVQIPVKFKNTDNYRDLEKSNIRNTKYLIKYIKFIINYQGQTVVRNL